MEKNRYKIINATTLKILGITSMLCDHTAILLQEFGLPLIAYNIMRGFGRLAFPIFCFLIVQGFINTSSVKKYILRMAIFAVISEVPYDYFMYGSIISLNGGNIIFNLTLGLLVLLAIRVFSSGKKGGMVLSFFVITMAMGVGYVLRLDYSWKCVLIVSFMYMARFDRLIMNSGVMLTLAFNSSMLGLASFFALIPINMYNGNRGRQNKWIFYVFYPLHLCVLIGLRFLLRQLL